MESTMETLAPVPAVNAELAPGSNAEADANAGGTEGGESATPAPEASTPAKDKVQERIDQLTREKYDHARRADQREYELERVNAEIAALKQQLSSKSETTQVAPEFPTLEQYGYDEGKHQAALVAHVTQLAEKFGEAAAEKKLNAYLATVKAEKASETWTSKESEFKKSKPDYADKVYRHPRDGGPFITDSMVQLLRESDVGPQIAYHLAENVEASAAIARLPPLAQAREFGRIEARLEAAKAQPKPAVSQAPPPPSKVDADDAVVTVKVDSADSDTLSDKEWTRRRNMQEQARIRKARGG
jgi:hypothetical protein